MRRDARISTAVWTRKKELLRKYRSCSLAASKVLRVLQVHVPQYK